MALITIQQLHESLRFDAGELDIGLAIVKHGQFIEFERRWPQQYVMAGENHTRCFTVATELMPGSPLYS